MCLRWGWTAVLLTGCIFFQNAARKKKGLSKKKCHAEFISASTLYKEKSGSTVKLISIHFDLQKKTAA